jgi:hypothetical protein
MKKKRPTSAVDSQLTFGAHFAQNKNLEQLRAESSASMMVNGKPTPVMPDIVKIYTMKSQIMENVWLASTNIPSSIDMTVTRGPSPGEAKSRMIEYLIGKNYPYEE